jgi:methanogenic corrinoid protein MtbC1
MPTNDQDGPSSESAQGSFSDSSDPSRPSSSQNLGEIGELSRQMLSRLSQTIEGDIIPRLMLAFDSRRTANAQVPEVSDRLGDCVDEFVQLLLTHDAAIAANYVSTLRSEGIPLSALYLDLLSPAARRLGEMWEDDECSFTDVTIGVCRMHQVLLEFSRCFSATNGASDPGQNALILPVPGEQHTFGLFMVMEFFRRAGWNCWSGSPSTRKEFHQLVQEQAFDVIGFSVSADQFVDAAAELIAEIRRGARNGNTVILVGGRAILDDPGLVKQIGADAMAADGQEAVREVSRLCRISAGRAT